MHITIPATRYSRQVILSLTFQRRTGNLTNQCSGWSICIIENPLNMSRGYTLMLYGPVFGRYANGAKAMLFRWDSTGYVHRQYPGAAR